MGLGVLESMAFMCLALKYMGNVLPCPRVVLKVQMQNPHPPPTPHTTKRKRMNVFVVSVVAFSCFVFYTGPPIPKAHTPNQVLMHLMGSCAVLRYWKQSRGIFIHKLFSIVRFLDYWTISCPNSLKNTIPAFTSASRPLKQKSCVSSLGSPPHEKDQMKVLRFGWARCGHSPVSLCSLAHYDRLQLL